MTDNQKGIASIILIVIVIIAVIAFYTISARSEKDDKNTDRSKLISSIAPSQNVLPTLTETNDSQQLDNNITATTITLDGVNLIIHSDFLPGEFYTSDPDDAIQTASSSSFNPFKEFSITTGRYGSGIPTENISNIKQGSAQSYRDYLTNFRIEQGGIPETGPTIVLFQQKVAGSYSIVPLNDNKEGNNTIVVEWVTEAENRLWIVRISQEIDGSVSIESILDTIAGTRINLQ